MIITKLSIIIPTYNERSTIISLLDKVKDVVLINNIAKEVIIINDRSTDNTEDLIKNYTSSNPSLDIKYFKHQTNQGKGAALHTGIKHASGEYLIIQEKDSFIFYLVYLVFMRRD